MTLFRCGLIRNHVKSNQVEIQ